MKRWIAFGYLLLGAPMAHAGPFVTTSPVRPVSPIAAPQRITPTTPFVAPTHVTPIVSPIGLKPGPVVPPPSPLKPVPVPVNPVNPVNPAPVSPATPTPSFGAVGSTLYRNGKAYVVQPAPAPAPRPVAPDAMRRLNALRKLAPTTASGRSPIVVQSGYAPVTFSMSAPDNLGRAPTSADITVNAGLDGRTPQQALALVKGNATMAIASGNQRFVDQTILGTHKAFTIAVNNAFTSGSPSNAFIKGQLAGAQVTILGTMSASTPVVIMAKKPTDAVSRFYARNDAGAYVEMPSLNVPVVMKAKLQNGVAGGVRVNYLRWGSSALSGPTVTVEEMGATVPDINHGSSLDPSP